MRPSVYFSLYPFSMSAGIMKPPSATTVATVEPDMAPNRPQAMTPAMPSPPGQPTDQNVCHLDEFVHNGPGCHNIAAKYEIENHHKGKFIHTPKEALSKRKDRQVGKKNKPHDRGKKEAHEDRHRRGHTPKEDKQDNKIA